MEPTNLPTELHLTHPKRALGQVQLDWVPQPGAFLAHDGKTYTVLERRHRYQLRAGRYQLHKVALYVQTSAPPEDCQLVQGRWLIGDLSCQFNARSELLRCAVNPGGPCQGCRYYEPVGEIREG
jgi:hypothetical protein